MCTNDWSEWMMKMQQTNEKNAYYGGMKNNGETQWFRPTTPNLQLAHFIFFNIFIGQRTSQGHCFVCAFPW